MIYHNAEEYIIVSCNYIDELNREISKRLKEGFLPCGSPYATEIRHCQAMIKLKERAPNYTADS